MVAALADIRMERQDLRQQRAQAEAAPMASTADGSAMAGAAPANRAQAAQVELYRPLRRAYVEAAGAHTLNAAHSETPFVDRLVAF